MSRNIRVIGILVLAMFVALFGSSTYIQAISTSTLAEDGRNTRVREQNFDIQRGPILVDGTPVAESRADDSRYHYQRVYNDPEVYAAVTGYYTSNQGSSQIESAMNAELTGASDSQFFSSLQRLFTGENPAGAAVQLTINPDAQKAAYEAMGSMQGAVLALDPTNGQILAMVSTPSFDPNRLAVHDDQQVISVYNELLNQSDEPLINRALGGNMNPPGSVFKLVVAAAALENGITTADAPLPNPGDWTLPGSSSVIYNPEHGATCGPGETTTLRTAITLSCNIPFAQLAVQLGADKIRQMAEAFGFNHEFDVPMTADASIYPTGTLDDAQTALTGFGQYEVRATPLQMALVSAAIANGGVLQKPTTVQQVLTANLQEIQGPKVSVFDTPISAQTAQALTSMMQDSVDHGAATNAQISGLKVAGKTGTAQNGANDPYSLWFTGFATSNGKTVAVAVVLEDGGGEGQSGTGNGLAATIGQQVMKAVLEP